MHYFLFLSLMLFNFSISSLSAASYELDMEEYFPSQNLLKSLTIEADLLRADVTFNDGTQQSLASNESWPTFSEISHIIFSGPDIECRLLFQSGYECSRSMHTFKLDFKNEVLDGRRETHLEIIVNPKHLIDREKLEQEVDLQQQQQVQNKTPDFGFYILRSILSNYLGQIQFVMKTSANPIDNSESAMTVDLIAKGQSLHLDLANYESLKRGSWIVRSDLAGKGSLLSCFILAFQKINAASQGMVPNEYYGETQEKIFSTLNFISAMVAPLCGWDGVSLITQGNFNYEETPNAFSSLIAGNLNIQTYDGSWKSGIGFRSFIAAGEDTPAEWSQTIIVTDPIIQIASFAGWVQLHGTEQLAILLAMPSITYYGCYFPKYFIQALTLVLTNLGEFQEDGTLHFSITSRTGESFSVAGIKVGEIGQLFIQQVKDYANSWW